MSSPQNQARTYMLLAVVFGIAGAVWIVYGFLSPRWVLYPLIGIVNLGIAYVCKQNSA
jgi:energy-converting hydrogenase Eha subunit H